MRRVLKKMEGKLKTATAVNVGFDADAQYPAAYSTRVDHRVSPKRTTRSVAQVAFWNEFGTKKSPARPFFRTMIAEKSAQWPDSLAYVLKAVNYDAKRALTQMGMGIQGQLVQSIRDWDSPPNAAFTIAVKGFNKPLIDEGIMVKSVTYRVST